MISCVSCGRKYELGTGEKPSDFQCTCGGNLEERRTLKDYQNQTEYKYNTEFFGETNDDLKKQNLFKRGYQLVDETDTSYVFSKKKPVIPIGILIVMAIIFLPLGLLYFWKEPKIKTVDKPSALTEPV